LRRVENAPERDLVWVAKTWEACLPPLVCPPPPEIFAATLAAPGFSSVVQRVRNLRHEVPKPKTWASTTTGPLHRLLPRPASPPSAQVQQERLLPPTAVLPLHLPQVASAWRHLHHRRLPTCLLPPAHAPLPVAHDTGACPPSCLGCLVHPLALPSSVPSAFCRRNGTRLPGFGKGRGGTQFKAAVWNCTVRPGVVAQAPACDLAGLAPVQRVGFPPHRVPPVREQYARRPSSSVMCPPDVLPTPTVAWPSSTCHIPVPGHHTPLFHTLSSPSAGRASNSGNVDIGGGGSRPCSPGSSGPA